MRELFALVEAGDIGAVQRTAWTQQQLDARDAQNQTPLMKAAISGDYKMALALKECGATLDLADDDGRKAVNLAALHGHSAVILALIEGGCGA